jgi:4-hydroxybenzoate polyprenyltransferase
MVPDPIRSSGHRGSAQFFEQSRGDNKFPIVVDLDNTLIKTDSLHEQIVFLLAKNLGCFVSAVPSIIGGRAPLKAAIAMAAPEPDETWPLNEELVSWLREQAASGRRLYLVSAAHASIVTAVARRLPIFEDAVGTEEKNLKGPIKAAYLLDRFPEGFAYAGDSPDDLAVWAHAQAAIPVGVSASTSAALKRLGTPVEAEFPAQRPEIRDWARALRIHHWTKNVLIFVPLVLAHGWTDLDAVLRTLLGFLLLLCVTSSTYLLNDLTDLQADRRHWSKRMRPIARGLIPIRTALPIAIGGITIGLLCGLLLSVWFAVALCGYVALTLTYSLGLKRVPLLDAFTIAVLFVARITMGIALVGHDVSDWLLAFSLALFFSLAVAKRHTEILRAIDANHGDVLAARGYRAADSDLTLVIGLGAGLVSVLVLVLYIVEDAFAVIGYSHPGWLRLIPLMVAIWLGRIWLLAHRGEMADDPVSFALRDRPSLVLGGALAVVFLLSI